MQDKTQLVSRITPELKLKLQALASFNKQSVSDALAEIIEAATSNVSITVK